MHSVRDVLNAVQEKIRNVGNWVEEHEPTEGVRRFAEEYLPEFIERDINEALKQLEALYAAAMDPGEPGIDPDAPVPVPESR